MLPRAAEEALSDAFSGKLLLRRKEEFCKKYTSKCRKKARQPTFASNKNRSGTTRVSEPGERYKREMAGDIKGRQGYKRMSRLAILRAKGDTASAEFRRCGILPIYVFKMPIQKNQCSHLGTSVGRADKEAADSA